VKPRSTSRRRLRGALAIAAHVAVIAGARLGAAAPQRDPAAAEALFVAGREAVERGDYAAACAKFAESDRLDPAPGTLMNLADCEEHIHHPAAAWSRWKEALEQLPPDDPRLPLARERAAAIERRVPRLTLRLATGAAGATVTRDGAEIGPGALGIALPVEPGAHTIVVTAPGREERRTTVTLNEGDAVERTLDAGAKLPEPAGSTAPAASTHGAGRRTLAFVLAGVGAVGVAAGAATGILAIQKRDDLAANCYPANVCNDAGADAANAGHTYATVSTVSFIAGGVALGAAVVLFATSPRSSPARGARAAPPRTTAWLAPSVSPLGGGAMLGGTFE